MRLGGKEFFREHGSDAMGDEMELDDEKFVQMRQYSRVDTYIPVDLRRVPPEERPLVRSRTSVESALTTMQSLPELDSEPLSDAFKVLNAKLDTIINLLTFQNNGYRTLQFSEVNLSAGGLSVLRPETYEEGEWLEAKMIFPTIPYVIFYVYGEVVHVVPDGAGGYRVSMEFKDLDEDIRDLIAKFVFERQREALRKKKRME